MSRLSELLLVGAVRNYSAALGDHAVGWLKGLRDPQVGRALALMHQRIGEPWSAEALAKDAALSRSAFADRFTGLVGMPPIRYLTIWRMETAKLHLRETAQTIGQLARRRLQVGGSIQPGIQTGVRSIAGALEGRKRPCGARRRLARFEMSGEHRAASWGHGAEGGHTHAFVRP